MEITINLSEEQAEVLKTIFAQIAPMPIYFPPVPKPKKLTKIEQGIQRIDEYKEKKAARKSK